MLRCSGHEWRFSYQHMIEQTPEAPPIYREAVWFPVQNLGRHIAFRPTMAQQETLRRCPFDWTRGAYFASQHLGQAKVDEADVTVTIQEHILGLDITVDHMARMHMLNGEAQLSGVELSHLSKKRVSHGESLETEVRKTAGTSSLKTAAASI